MVKLTNWQVLCIGGEKAGECFSLAGLATGKTGKCFVAKYIERQVMLCVCFCFSCVLCWQAVLWWHCR